jgi:hypothetical protein
MLGYSSDDKGEMEQIHETMRILKERDQYSAHSGDRARRSEVLKIASGKMQRRGSACELKGSIKRQERVSRHQPLSRGHEDANGLQLGGMK